MSSLKKQGLTALIWDFFGKLSTQGMGFVVTIILARLLEPSDFGLIAMIMVVVGIAQVFTDIGLGGALIQRKDVDQTHYSSVFYFNIFVATLLFLITFLSADKIANFYDVEELVPLIQVISTLFIFNAFGSVQTIKLRKQLNYALITKAGFIASMLSGVIGVTLALYDFGVWSLLAQILSQSIINSLLLWLLSGWRPTYEFSLLSLKQLWAFGFRMFLVGFMDAITSRLDFLIIGKLFPVATLGYFQRAKSFNLLIIQYTSGSLMSVLFPILSKIQDDLPRFKEIVIESLNILSLIVFLLVGGIYLSSEEIIVFLFSEKWLPSVPYMELLILSAFSYPINSLLVNILSSRGNSKAFLKMAIIKKLILISNFALVFKWGIEGYLIGLIFISLISTFVTIHFASHEISVKRFFLSKPILIQLIIFITSLSTVLVLNAALNDLIGANTFIEFVLKNTVFVFVFLLCNWFLKTDSWLSILKQLFPVYLKFKRKY